jgi:predicted nucleotidyltransferase
MKVDLCFHPRFISKNEIYRHLPRILKVFRRHEVTTAFIFGSILYTESSNDIDIGVFFKEKIRYGLIY